MRPVEIFFAVLGVAVIGGAGYLMTRPTDPVVMAKFKCESALERFSGHDIDRTEAARATVTGDAHTGRVEMPFTLKEVRHLGACVFRNGEMITVDLDGRLLAGLPR